MWDMANVLIAESDADVRDVISELVRGVGHAVTAVKTLSAAMETLMDSPDPYIVLLDTRLDGDYLAAVVLLELAHGGPLYRHAFVLLSTEDVFRLPSSLQLLRGVLSLPVVSMPFDVDDLLHELDRAAERLRPLASRAALVEMGRIAPPSAASHNGHGQWRKRRAHRAR